MKSTATLPYWSCHSNAPISAIRPVIEPGPGDSTVILRLCMSSEVLMKQDLVSCACEIHITHTTRKAATFKSSTSSSYRSFSSGLSGARSASTEFSSPEPFADGSTITGCISEMRRVAPTGRLSCGAIDATRKRECCLRSGLEISCRVRTRHSPPPIL